MTQQEDSAFALQNNFMSTEKNLYRKNLKTVAIHRRKIFWQGNFREKNFSRPTRPTRSVLFRTKKTSWWGGVLCTEK